MHLLVLILLASVAQAQTQKSVFEYTNSFFSNVGAFADFKNTRDLGRGYYGLPNYNGIEVGLKSVVFTVNGIEKFDDGTQKDDFKIGLVDTEIVAELNNVNPNTKLNIREFSVYLVKMVFPPGFPITMRMLGYRYEELDGEYSNKEVDFASLESDLKKRIVNNAVTLRIKLRWDVSLPLPPFGQGGMYLTKNNIKESVEEMVRTQLPNCQRCDVEIYKASGHDALINPGIDIKDFIKIDAGYKRQRPFGKGGSEINHLSHLYNYYNTEWDRKFVQVSVDLSKWIKPFKASDLVFFGRLQKDEYNISYGQHANPQYYPEHTDYKLGIAYNKVNTLRVGVKIGWR